MFWLLIGAGVFWATCGIVAHGFEFAHLRSLWHIHSGTYRMEDFYFSFFFRFLPGPFGLLIVVVNRTTKRGLKFW